MFRRVVLFIAIMTVAPAALLADFSYQETTTITGGMLKAMMNVAGVFSKQAREPIQSTVAVKGDRMAHRSATHAGIIDLGAQTITSIDLQKKTYTVMTFDQMKQMLDQMSQKMQQNKDKIDVNYKVSARETGNHKQIAGFDTKELMLQMEMQGTDQEKGQTGAMVITTDMWMAPKVPGYEEIQSFYRRMAEKLNWTPGGSMFMSRPDVAKGMAEVYKEIAKLDAMPVFETITMGGQGTGPAPNSGTAANPDAQPQQQTQQERPSLGGALGGALGGRFGLGRKKNQQTQESQPAPASSGNTATASGTLVEMKMEMSGFSSAPVDASQFEVPAGFKKVEQDMRRIQ